jgi:hypothetical protein
MEPEELRVRARELDQRLQACAREYELLWEDLQAALDVGERHLDPDLTVGNRLLGLATGIPQLGRVFGRQDPPARAAYVVTSGPGDGPRVEGVFLSRARAHVWVSRQQSTERYQVEVRALDYPELTGALRRPRAGDRDSLATEAEQFAIDPADVAEALAMAAQMEELAAELDAVDRHVLGQLRYEGVLYVRPVGRGVILDASGEELDEAVERTVVKAIDRPVTGDFVRARVLLEVLADEGSGVWPRETGGR